MNNKIDVELDLKNRNSFVSEYNEKTLEPMVRDYILNELVGYPLYKKVNIIIKPKYNIDKSEYDSYIKVIKKEFRECMIDIQGELRASNRKKALFSLLGFMFVIISYKAHMDSVLAEVLLILGWVCLYEAIYMLMFTDVNRIKRYKRYKQVHDADIKFK